MSPVSRIRNSVKDIMMSLYMVAQIVQNSIFKLREIFIFRNFFILSEVFIFRNIFIFRDIFVFSEISVCTEIFLKNSSFKNVKKLLSRTAMLESFWGTLAGLSENLFAPASGKRNSTVDAISGIFQNFKNLQRWRL